MLRKAIHSGTWYPKTKSEIESYMTKTDNKLSAIAAVCPHAGWIYSGKTAGRVYSSLEPKDLYIIIGPNHRGIGSPASIISSGEWETPIGNLEIDEVTAQNIMEHSGLLISDRSAHSDEHSLEVQAPFIKLISPNSKIVPIVLFDYSLETCKNIGLAVAKAIAGKNAMIIASSDMSHYISASSAKKMDKLAIEQILHLNPAGLLETVQKYDISMCGSGPVASALWAAKELGATQAKLLDYSNSGDVTGDNYQVVGYAGIAIY